MHALKVLEFDKVRERLQFHSETTIGAALAADLAPSFKRDEVWDALAYTAEAHDALAKHSVPSLGGARDLRDALKRAGKGGVLGAQELFLIGEALSSMLSMRTFLTPQNEAYPLLYPYAQALPDQRRLQEQLLDNLEFDGTVKSSASATLSTIRQKKKTASSRIMERIQQYTSGKSRELLSDPIYTVRDGRYVIPLKAENRGKIRGIVHDTSSSGQTIFLEPEDVLQLGNALREAEAAERTEITKILTALSAKVGSIADETIAGLEACGTLDLYFAKARLGYEMHGTLPQPVGKPSPKERPAPYIGIQGGKHPLLNVETAVPLDIAVGRDRNVLITGPNTGGKTVAIKAVGLFVLMAQAGMMVPALDIKLEPFTQVWADIGDEQSLQQSLSTFSGHLKNIAEALKWLRQGALVLFDEIGAGTDPAEGAALAKAILTEMHERGATVLASTHYGELKAFAYNTEGFTNAAMEFDPKTLRPTYRLMMGAPGASHALRIAERYGISKEVVEKARENLGSQALDVAAMMESLELSTRQARQAQGEADRRLTELKKAEQKAARKLSEADEIRRTVHDKAQGVIEAALREIRLEAGKLFDELKSAPTDGRVHERIRKGLKDLDEVGRDFAREFEPERGPAPEGLHRGSIVRISGFTQTGTVVEDPKNDQVLVQMGMIKMTVALDRLELAIKASEEPYRPRGNIQLQKALHANTEIDLRHLRVDEAIRTLERFLDDAVLAGLPNLRIVHGKGEGVLRKATQDFLKKNKSVAEFRDGEPAEGGAGVTVATLA